MALFSKAFNLNKSQSELDFVDAFLHTDNTLFIDPFAISQRPDHWSHECHRTILSFFQEIVNLIRSNRHAEARQLLLHLREPNETRLGLSSGKPQGAGVGNLQAEQLYQALKDSAAVKTGFLSSLEECELMIEGISRDKISDLTTNIIRRHLVSYTQDQCKLHGIQTQDVPLPPCFNPDTMEWESGYHRVPVVRDTPVVLVPKAIVRYDPSYEHQTYYRHFVLNFLQAEHLRAGSGLVHTLRDGRRRVYKKDLERQYPLTKEFLYEFSREHPEVLREYREALQRLELTNTGKAVDPEDEAPIARMLAASLAAILPGDVSADAYHNLMVGLVEFLFFPQLFHPVKEQPIHHGRKRIDIVMENCARSGVFYRQHDVHKLPCGYVMFECKNYRTEVANPELDQLIGRFGTNRSRLGFLCCRRFEDRATFVQRCKDTLADGHGLIVPLDDSAILRCLKIVEETGRAALEEEFSRMFNEIRL